jgi:hypothetical protein
MGQQVMEAGVEGMCGDECVYRNEMTREILVGGLASME